MTHGVKSGKRELMGKFLNAMVERAAQKLEQDETCELHKNQRYVAIDRSIKKFGCEKCTYEGVLPDPQFISWGARDVKDAFDEQYFEFMRVAGLLDSLQPQLIIKDIRDKIGKYFGTIRRKVDEIESDCLKKIKDSPVLKDVAHSIEYLHGQCDEELLNLVEEQKGHLDKKTDAQKYAYIVLKGKYYEDLTHFLKIFSEQIQKESQST